MVNPKSLLNLRQFRKGGPGRPKGTVSITEALRRRLQAHPELIEEIVSAWIIGAKTKPELLRELLDRLEGRVPQGIIGGDGGPLQIKLVEVVKDYGNTNSS